MDIKGLNSVLNSYQKAAVSSAKDKVAYAAGKAEAAAGENREAAAVYEETPKVESGDYAQKIAAMLAESKKRIAEFQDMFVRYLGGQAANYDVATWSRAAMEAAFEKATPEDVEAAKAAIAEGGYYSVNSVATRIMDMATALAGGDSSKIEALRAAVEEGFKQAGSIYGAELPGICQDTYKEVMNRFDAWENPAAAEDEAGE